MTATRHFGWGRVARLGLVQAALGAIVVLATSTLNRVMVVELALPALLPGALVALHYGVQVLRPRMGHGSDVGGRSTPWIAGGMGVLARAASPLLATFKTLPPGVRVDGDLIGIDIAEVLRSRNAGWLVPLVRRLRLHTSEAGVTLKVSLGI